jgi:pyruvate,orthophosphate dikinase
MYASIGVMTIHGGMTSHAAVVARGMGRVCICGVGSGGFVRIDEVTERIYRPDGSYLSKGDIITLDGCLGIAYIGPVKTMPAAADKDYQTVITWADKYKRMAVYANAETMEDVQKASELGAEVDTVVVT